MPQAFTSEQYAYIHYNGNAEAAVKEYHRRRFPNIRGFLEEMFSVIHTVASGNLVWNHGNIPHVFLKAVNNCRILRVFDENPRLSQRKAESSASKGDARKSYRFCPVQGFYPGDVQRRL